MGLEHLLERSHGSWDARCMWEEVLSGGEQQRIALSRALFHRPDFVLLDECTSMVAADAEERLYDCVTAVGVTPLTMSQRLFLPKLHKQLAPVRGMFFGLLQVEAHCNIAEVLTGCYSGEPVLVSALKLEKGFQAT